MEEIISQVKALYADAAAFDAARLADLYTENVEFVDPVHRVIGLDALVAYLAKVYSAVDSCEFVFGDSIVQGNQAILLWTMTYRHSKLQGGEELSLSGNSLLRVENGKIAYQVDYYDLGAMVYEHIPILGRVVGSVKKRLA